jgi:hypothetical protein
VIHSRGDIHLHRGCITEQSLTGCYKRLMSNIRQLLSGSRPDADKFAFLTVSADNGSCGSVSYVLGDAAGGYMCDDLWFFFAKRAQAESSGIVRYYYTF